MHDRTTSPVSSSSSTTAVGNNRRSLRRHVVEEECGDPVACTGKSCQSCTAAVIADCVAVCCCPCAVVNILALVFLKLPYAVARKYIGRRKKKSRRRIVEQKRKCAVGVGDIDGISGNGGRIDGTLEIVVSTNGAGIGEEGVGNDNFSAELKAEDVWLELYEVGHLGFGRVSFTGNWDSLSK